MDPSNVLSDDDYDVISNPGTTSMDNSMILTNDVQELPASEDAHDRFETVRWTAAEIHAYVRRGLNWSPGATMDHKQVKVYVDGSFDMFDIGHALQLRQAKLAFPSVYLIVGVFSDDLLQQNHAKSTWPEVERVEIVRHCRWVNEVVMDAPWKISLQFLKSKSVDFVAIDEGCSVDPCCDKARVKAYDELKKHDKIIKTRKTVGLSSQRSRVSPTPSQSATPTLSSSHNAPDFTAHVDMYGLGY